MENYMKNIIKGTEEYKKHNQMENLNQNNVRTDLAVEAHEMNQQRTKGTDFSAGVKIENEGDEEVKITRVKIVSKEGEESIGKPIGNYITLDIPDLSQHSIELYEKTCRAMAKELRNILSLGEKSTVLVVGLGNWNITPDALGPRVVSNLMVTRHLLEYVPEEIDEGVRPLCSIAPGVLGLTGIETVDIVKGVVDKVKPELVIAIDALASRKLGRISTTIQIADTGISPGSGVGNKRMELSEKTLGVKVVAIGVPTVVDAATMASDTIDEVMDSLAAQAQKGSDFYNMINNLDRNEKYQLIKEVLDPYIGNLIVTTKEIDEVIDKVSKIVANGINIAIHDGIDLKDVDRYLN